MFKKLMVISIFVMMSASCSQVNLMTTSNPLDTSPDVLKAGKALFIQHCAICHGLKGDGKGELAKSLETPPANLLASRGMPDGVMAFRITEGGDVMPAWKGTLSETQIWQLVAYINNMPVE